MLDPIFTRLGLNPPVNSNGQCLSFEFPIFCIQVSELLDKFDNVVDALSEDVEAAVALSKVGSDLILEHEFARDSLEPKCTQLRIMVKTQEILFLERRQTQLKFVDLFDKEVVHK